MSVTRRMGAGALVLGLAAGFAGSPYRAARGRIDIERTVRTILDGGDHVSALELAGWIRDRKPGLRVIDVRPPAEFAQYAIPTAENLPLEALLHASFAPHETIVLYSEGGAHAGQAWVLLRAMGVANAWFIAGGLADWDEEVMAPVIVPGTQAETISGISRYFGGTPSVGDSASSSAAPVARRRGC